MSEEASVKAEGMAGVLTTLASSGDNWVKLLIIGGIIMNSVVTSREGKNTREDVEQARKIALSEIHTIYRNQRRWQNYANHSVEEHEKIMEKLGIAVEKKAPPYFEALPEEELKQ